MRALHAAVCRSFGDIPSPGSFKAAPSLQDALNDAEASRRDPRRTGPSPAALVEVARCLAADGPLLLVLDEFGKNLEAVVAGSSPSDTDPYLLQQLAEAGGGQGLPIFVVTLQHQSFDDYLSAVDEAKRREWAKVQGRFEDIAYVDSPAQTRALIGSVFTVGDEKLQSRIRRWARPQAQTMGSLGVGDLAKAAAVADCWPLHPVTAIVLSELCQRYGQHERTLFSFLTSPEVAGTSGFLSRAQLPARGALPTLGLDAVYDYFVGSGGLSAMAAASNSRWIEIATRLRDAHGLSARQERAAKAVAMLNLVSTSGSVRASAQVLELAEPGSADTLKELEDSGLITYRSVPDEYRIWQGTDVDVRTLLEEARQQVRQLGEFEVMASMPDPPPAVAARHSAKHDCLRVFASRYASCLDKADPLDAFSPYDGQVLLVVDGDQPPLLTGIAADGAKPTVAAIARPEELSRLDASAREVVSLHRVLQDPSVSSDWVARHELSERLATAGAAFDQAVFSAFGSGSCQWLLLDGGTETELAPGRGTSALSDAANRAYPGTPEVPNEVLNRTHLTSQGAKARRLVIEAMLERASEAQLGFEGNGPEVAMYKAALFHTRLHVHDDTSGQMSFRPPTGKGAAKKLQPAWKAMEAEFNRAQSRRVNLNDVYASLLSPPVGMKAGVVPVIVMAGLLVHRDSIAIYEHGTFKHRLTADIAERMVKNPGFFEIKHFANASGARLQAVSALAAHLGGDEGPDTPAKQDTRVANVLAVVVRLASRAKRLDNYTQKTGSLAPGVLAVRAAVLRAVEPDELLFEALPEALGLPPAPSGDSEYPQAEELAAQVAAAMSELEAASDRLMQGALDLLVSCSGCADRQAVVERTSAVDADALDPDIRPFMLALANDGTDDDLAWIKTVATVVSQKSPAEWTDEDARRFRLVLPEQMAAYERLVALYSDSGALRVTVTRPDGREHARIVGLNDEQRIGLSAVLEEAMAKAEKVVGTGGQATNALLALLGNRMLEGATHG